MILKRLDGILELAGGLFVLLTGKNRDAAGSRMRRILADGMLVNHARGAGSVDQPHRAAHRLQPWIGDGRFQWNRLGREAQDCASDSTATATLAAKPGSDEAKVNRTRTPRCQIDSSAYAVLR
jgi:hypothetical protein